MLMSLYDYHQTDGTTKQGDDVDAIETFGPDTNEGREIGRKRTG